MPHLFPDREYPVICTYHGHATTRFVTASSLAVAIARTITADQRAGVLGEGYGTSLDHEVEAERLGFPVYQWREVTESANLGQLLGTAMADVVFGGPRAPRY